MTSSNLPVQDMTQDIEKYEYSAFISYRHLPDDRKWAKWLFNALETYRVPKSLRKKGYPARLGKLFRDEEEIAASADLSDEIRKGLEKSKFLIVVCSKNTPGSKWVTEEIRTFHALGRSERILAILVDGEPAESFPNLLLKVPHEVTSDGEVVWKDEHREPIAADVRFRGDIKSRELKKRALLRIAASILGTEFDDLVRREEAREKKRLLIGAVASTVLAASMSLMAGFAFLQKQEAVKQQGIAKETLDAAIRTADGLVNRIASEFEGRGIPNDVSVKILQEANKLQLELFRSDSPERRLRRLRVSAALQFGRILIAIRQVEDAEEHLVMALSESEALSVDYPDEPGFYSDQANIIFELSKVTGTREEKIALLNKNIERIQKHIAAWPHEPVFRFNYARNLARLGDLNITTNVKDTRSKYEENLNIIEELYEEFPDVSAYQTGLLTAHRRLANFYEARDKSKAQKLLEEGIGYANTFLEKEPANNFFRSEVAGYLDQQARLAVDTTPDDALILQSQSLKHSRRLASNNPRNNTYKLGVASGLIRLAYYWRFFDETKSLDMYQESEAIIRDLIQKEPENTLYRQNLSDILLEHGKLKLGTDRKHALGMFQEGYKVVNALLRKEPDSSHLLSRKATFMSQIARELQTTSPEEASRLFGEHIDLLRKIVAKEPENEQFRRTLVSVLREKASAQVRSGLLGPTENALELLEEAAEYARKLDLTAFTANRPVVYNLALVMGNAGNIWKRVAPDQPPVLFPMRIQLLKKLAKSDVTLTQRVAETIRLLLDSGKEGNMPVEHFRAAHEIIGLLSDAQKAELGETKGEDVRSKLAESLYDRAFKELENKRFKDAEASSREAIRLFPDVRWLYLPLSYALMFQDEVEKANDLHLRMRGKETFNGETWETVVIGDFAYLRKRGLSHPFMAEFETLHEAPKTSDGKPGSQK